MIKDHHQGIGQNPNHRQHYQCDVLMDGGLLELALGREGLECGGVNGPAASAQLLNELQRDGGEVHFGSIEVGAVYRDLFLSLRAKSADFLNLDALDSLNPDGFDDTHHAAGHRPVKFRKRRADQRDGRDAVVILNALEDFAVYLPFDLPLQASFTTAHVGVADLYAIDGGDHAPPCPLRTEDAVPLQAFGYRATQLKYRLRGLKLHGVAESVFAQWSDALGKDAGTALEFNAMRCR